MLLHLTAQTLMPIQTNFARECITYHQPIKMNHEQVHQLLNLQIVGLEVKCTDGYIVLRLSPCVMVAWPQTLWDIIGEAITLTEQPWWDFVLLVTDDTEYAKKVGCTSILEPDAHALSILRVYDSGKMEYLFLEPRG
jgi:hypothetical protein